MPLAVAPLVILRDLGPLPGTSLRHTVWRKGMRLLVFGPNTPLRPADFAIPGQMITVVPDGYQDNLDALAKATTIILKFGPGQLRPPTVMNWTVDGIVAYSKICTHVGCPVALYEQTTHHILCPCHQSTFDADPRRAGASSVPPPGRCRSCRSAPTRRASWSPRATTMSRSALASGSGDDKSKTTEALLEGTGRFLDDRLRAARAVRGVLRKLFPDHWTFLLGEIALYSFIILLLTGTFLTFFFQPSMTEVVYHGAYTPLRGVRMSEAYASTMNISFDVRGGLLMRQIHHWAALLFMAAIMVHMLRMFFTGAYRKPREFNWLIGIVLFTLGMLEGLFGYSLPDDLLSGTGLKITQGVLQSIPIVGTYGSFFLFGGEFPGHDIIPRLYIIHVLLIPALLLALISAHLFFMFHQKHTQMPGKGRTKRNVVGAPMYPYFMAKTGAFFLFIFAVLALLSTFAQINPIWLFGPYNPSGITAGSQPDFYMGALEGALRIMPAWEWNVFGHTFAFNVFIPALVPLGIIFTGAALWPFLEQWVIGDRQRAPRQRPATQRADPDRDRHGRDHLLRRPVAGGRQRRHRPPAPDPAVHADLDRPVRGLPRPYHRLLGDQADLPRPAAQGRPSARARGRDRHHPAAAQR